jgi:DNA-binding MarR family transcriptional regulator
MTDYNEAKYETLQEIYDQGEISASDLAYTNGLTLQNASTRLRRYSRQGLLGRYRNGREYIYYITDRGVERLEWLTTNRITQEWLKYANQRCPVKKKVPDDEQNDEHDLYDTESNDENNMDLYTSEDEDEDIEIYEDDDEPLERPSSREEEVDDLYSFLKNIQRCRVNRNNEDSDFDEEIA